MPGTPANIGYVSGALKHSFDGICYPCLEATVHRPSGLYVHGGALLPRPQEMAIR